MATARQAASPSRAQSVSLSIYLGMYVGCFCVNRKIIVIPKFIDENQHKKRFNRKPSFLARKMIIIYDIGESPTATAFKGKLYTKTTRLVFLVHIEITKRRHLSICDTMMSINLTQKDIASVDRKSNKRLGQQASRLNLNAELYF